MEPSARAALYQTLDTSKSETRLLRILHSTDSGTVLHCELVTVPLDGLLPEYHALSYEWGPPDLSEVNSVLVNSHKAITTLNLWLALNHLAKNRYYWIDFICINQGDLVERASQVALMTRIFNTAAIVEVWLGPENHLNSKALELLVEYENTDLKPPNERRDTSTLWNIAKLDHWEGVLHILDNTYWSRMWIIQEMVVSKSPGGPLLRCGNQCGEFINFYMMLRDSYDNHVRSVEAEALGIGPRVSRRLKNVAAKMHVRIVPALIEFHSSTWNATRTGGCLDLALLLHCYSGQQCVDQRDRVYALLGFSNQVNGLELEVNYRKSVEEVYMSTAIYVICATSTLDILAFVQPRTVDSRVLPSWVPDWRTYDKFNKIIYADKQEWNSSANMGTSYRLLPSARSLFSIGMIIGTISTLEFGVATSDQFLHDIDRSQDWNTVRDLFLGRLKFAQSILEVEVNMQQANDATIAALYEVQCLSCYNNDRIRSILPFDEFRIFCHGLFKRPLITSPLYLASCMVRPSQMFGIAIAANSRPDHSTESVNSIGIGETIGLGPLYTRLGDIVVVLGGCKHPIILRKAPVGYKVVGEACIAGFMDGQAVGRFALREFELV